MERKSGVCNESINQVPKLSSLFHAWLHQLCRANIQEQWEERDAELGLSLSCYNFLHYGPFMQWHGLMNMGLDRSVWM